MTDVPDRLRAAALILPEAEEAAGDGEVAFLVAAQPFARVAGHTLHVRDADGGWIAINLGGEPDWARIEDAVARGWELAAPRRLLEAGGR